MELQLSRIGSFVGFVDRYKIISAEVSNSERQFLLGSVSLPADLFSVCPANTVLGL